MICARLCEPGKIFDLLCFRIRRENSIRKTPNPARNIRNCGSRLSLHHSDDVIQRFFHPQRIHICGRVKAIGSHQAGLRQPLS